MILLFKVRIREYPPYWSGSGVNPNFLRLIPNFFFSSSPSAAQVEDIFVITTVGEAALWNVTVALRAKLL